ncbi:MAG TPA: response regulator [Gaiellaceae bacterium]|nr:response regulator [Gaiellaceae bacterium]
MALPSGIVTFLFTDIEGSTGLARSLGDEFPEVLETHRRLIRTAVEQRGGQEVDARADELFAAFAETGAAVEAAVAAQRALAEHEWPSGRAPRVRMGIHSGEATPGENGYVGLDVHRAARVCAAAVGGQILVSSAARARVPAGSADFADLGEHRLAGFPDRERIFQVLHEDLPGELVAPAANGSPKGDLMRVVIADDSVLLREGIAKLLEESGFEVAGQSSTADDLLLKVRSYKPDVAIIDIRMPPTHTDEGLRAAKEIRETHPDVGVLVLSQYVEAGYALELLQGSAEGVGYLLKDRVADVTDFADAVRRVAEGGSALDPTVVSRLVGRRRGEDPLDALTPREREVLELMAEGRSNQAIAEKLVVTPRAVEKHVTSIFTKLNLPASAEDHRRVLAVITYLNA